MVPSRTATGRSAPRDRPLGCRLRGHIHVRRFVGTNLEDDITVVGEATTGAESVEQARTTRTDGVLMDIRMPTLDGIQTTTQIVGTRGLGQVRVPNLTTYDTDDNVFEALQADASGFLLKDAGGTHPRQPCHGETRRPRPRPTGRHRRSIRTGQPNT